MRKWKSSSVLKVNQHKSSKGNVHCPIIIRLGNQDLGTKPFRFNNRWLAHMEFKNVVERGWLNSNVIGWKAFVLKEKLKILKLVIRSWNVEVFRYIDNKVQQLQSSIGELDLIAEERLLLDVEVEHRRLLVADLWQKLRDEESLLRQKSRQKWLVEGDGSTSYFHACIKARRRKKKSNGGSVGG